VRELIEEGYCIIPNFLPTTTFEAVLAEYKAATEDLERVPYDIPTRDGVIMGSIRWSPKDQERNLVTIAALAENPFVRNVIKGHEGRTEEDLDKLGTFKWMHWEAFKAEGSLDRNRNSKSPNDIHADTFHTITKFFLFLNDVDRSNGAHIYVPRSHRLTSKRLWFDYCNSFGTKDGAPRIEKNYLSAMSCEVRHIEVPANTLAIINAQSFHADGAFPFAGPKRQAVVLEYRSHPFR